MRTNRLLAVRRGVRHHRTNELLAVRRGARRPRLNKRMAVGRGARCRRTKGRLAVKRSVGRIGTVSMRREIRVCAQAGPRSVS
jgi:hypothetical protein